MKNSRRVVITGMGAVTPLACDLETTWKRIVAGESGIDLIKIFDASGFATRIAGEVKNFPFKKWHDRDALLKDAFRGTFFALEAAEEALRQADLADGKFDPERFGIYFAAGDSGTDSEGFARTLLAAASPDGRVESSKYIEAAQKYLSGGLELESQSFMTVSHLARIFNLRGPVSNCITACAASLQALGEGFELIRRGDADLILAGGSNSMIYPLGISGFSLLTALSTRNEDPQKASRPFDKNRKGFVMAEGGGVMVLEDLEHAFKRGATIYGEILSQSCTADAYRLTDMDPEVKGAAEAVTQALRKSGLQPGEIDYISAHGTSTAVNDVSETRVIKKVFGDVAKKVPMSSIKSQLGHMITASGVVAAQTCLLAMRDSVLPPTINLTEPDPDCDLDYVPNRARKAPVNAAIANSFGFGGQNVCLVLKKY